MSSPKPIVSADAKSCSIMSEYLKFMGQGELCLFDAAADSLCPINIGPTAYAAPVRLGAVLDHLYALKRKAADLPEQVLDFAGGTLDAPNGIFMVDDTGQSVKLTEKEVAILSFLYTQKGTPVQKQDLLSSVWEYAESAETHTLETHIYRLRQKIEADPANPVTLVTRDNGYSAE